MNYSEYDLKASLTRKTNALNHILEQALKLESDNPATKEILLLTAQREYLNSRGWRNEVLHPRLGLYFADLWLDPLAPPAEIQYDKKQNTYCWINVQVAIKTEEAFTIQMQRDLEQERSILLGVLLSRVPDAPDR